MAVLADVATSGLCTSGWLCGGAVSAMSVDSDNSSGQKSLSQDTDTLRGSSCR